MESLVDSKETEEVSWGFRRSGAPFALPKQGCEVVSFAKDNVFSDVEVLSDGFQVE